MTTRAERLARFGITEVDYQLMLAAQDGGCAICGELPTEDRALAVDHDHESGGIRGLLCFACNTGLGKFNDDPARLAKAIEYLKESAKSFDDCCRQCIDTTHLDAEERYRAVEPNGFLDSKTGRVTALYVCSRGHTWRTSWAS